jgi:hypothetical protein
MKTYPAVVTKKLDNGNIMASLCNTTQFGQDLRFFAEDGTVGLPEHLKALARYSESQGYDLRGCEWVTAPLDSFSYIHLLVPARAKTYKVKTPLSPTENLQNSVTQRGVGHDTL